MKPNLFSLATKELSQDAFIAWFMQWADPQTRSYNESLHRAALDFVRSLISLQHEENTLIKKIKAGRQRENIDIWAEVNDDHLIIIEDKTSTRHHSNQLSRYREIAQNWCEGRNTKLTCVYLKTHSESLSSLKSVEEESYSIFTRSDFLAILNRHDVNNDIYQDFRQHLQGMEDSEAAYKKQKPESWRASQWIGLYQNLERSGIIESWDYVPNQTGGFWNAILGGTKHEKMPIYLQIEQGLLCIKVGEVYENRSSIRNNLHQFIINNAIDEIPIQKPARFGSGVYMTVATVSRETWLITDSQGIIDVEATSRKLSAYKKWLCEMIDNKLESI